MLLREELLKAENIEATDDDFLKLAEETASRFNIPAENLLSIYKQNDDIRMRILNDKVLDFLIANAKVTEKKELRKKQELGNAPAEEK